MAYVVEKIGGVERAYDTRSRMLMDRIVFLGSGIDDEVANEIVAQLLFLEANDKGKPIQLYINSPGGVITSGMAILDTMRYITSPVNTICIGQACSMGAMLLACGTGTRLTLPNSRIMIHQPSSGMGGMVSDMEIQFKEVQRMKKTLNVLLAEKTGQTVEKIEKDTDRDYFMTADEALAYGIVDKVVKP